MTGVAEERPAGTGAGAAGVAGPVGEEAGAVRLAGMWVERTVAPVTGWM